MIIGLNGKAGSGKDTAFLRLRQLVNVPVERISFADKLKESAAQCLGVAPGQFNAWKNNPEARIVVIDDYTKDIWSRTPHIAASVTVREFLQRYGTEAHRDIFGDNFWVDAALPVNDLYRDSENLYVVTDVRFPNEEVRIHENGGLVVRITGMIGDTGTHASEQVLENVDWEISNVMRDDKFSFLDGQLRMMLYANGMREIIKDANLVEAL